MTVANGEELEGLQRAGAAVASARDAMLAQVTPGITTADLDAIGRDVLEAHGARSAPRLAYGFPGWTCISVNDAIAHGVPSPHAVLQEGDLVNVDVSAELDRYWADTGASIGVGEVSGRLQRLLHVTRKAQWSAMMAARAGRRLHVVSQTVQRLARRGGFRVVRTLGGHGIGRSIHEEPYVSNVPDETGATVLHEGLVLTVEPFFTLASTDVREDADGWTLRTCNGCVGAQFEHTLVVTKGEPIVLTRGANPA